MAHSSQGRSSGAMRDLQSKAGDKIKSAQRAAEDTGGQVTRQARQAGEGLQEVADNLKGALDKSIRDQPMATLALTAVAGFFLGALWKR